MTDPVALEGPKGLLNCNTKFDATLVTDDKNCQSHILSNALSYLWWIHYSTNKSWTIFFYCTMME